MVLPLASQPASQPAPHVPLPVLQVFTLTVPESQEAAAQAAVAAMSPSARLTYSLGGTLKYELPTEVGRGGKLV